MLSGNLSSFLFDTRARTTPESLPEHCHAGIVQGCGSPVRVSRTEMALLTRVLFTASQVLTTDSKSTIAETKIFNLLAVDGFQAAAPALVPTAYNECDAWFFADRGWCLRSSASLVDGQPRSCGGRTSFRACRFDASWDWIEATCGPWEFILHLWHVVLALRRLELSVAVPSECVGTDLQSSLCAC